MNKPELAASYQSQLERVGVPTNQAKSAADVLASQTEGELPVPLAEGSEELHIVRSAYSWMVAKQNS
ncbi:MAG TPA: hypothetical protein V6D48_02035 [Oculatellaceae cyanobacterium]